MSILELAVEDLPAGHTLSFGMLTYENEQWDLSHLDSFAFLYDLLPDFQVTVLVFFSCHCFTRSFERDGRRRSDIPKEEIFDDGRERRVLCPARYEASRRLLRDLMTTLATRRITLADDRRSNFVTFETTDDLGVRSTYAVFFEVTKEKFRQRRLILRVQSAYVLESGLTKRQSMAKRVTLRSILLAAMEGRKIRP
jgi:hypothetical protein